MRPSSAIPMPIMKKEFIADDQIDDSQLFLDDIDNDDENDDYFLCFTAIKKKKR